MKNIWVFLQLCSVPVFFIFLRLLRVKIINENEIAPQKGCLFISNHQSKLDPFFILNARGLRKNIVDIPYQFPVLDKYMRKIITGKIIALLGGFSIGRTIEEKARGLFYIREVLENKGSVLIFPEGKLVDGNHSFEDFQKGYTYLMTENIQVVLIKIKNFRSLGKYFFSKNRPSIRFHTISSTQSKVEILNIIKDFYSK